MTGEKIYSIIALRSSLRILATHAGAAESDISALSPSKTTRTRRIVPDAPCARPSHIGHATPSELTHRKPTGRLGKKRILSCWCSYTVVSALMGIQLSNWMLLRRVGRRRCGGDGVEGSTYDAGKYRYTNTHYI